MPKSYGIDESGDSFSDRLFIVAYISEDPTDRSKEETIPWEEWKDDDCNYRFLELRRKNEEKAPEWYRRRVSAVAALVGPDIEKDDVIYVDRFALPKKLRGDIIEFVVEDLQEMGTDLPADNIVCEHHADKHYRIVNKADVIAYRIYHQLVCGTVVYPDLEEHRITMGKSDPSLDCKPETKKKCRSYIEKQKPKPRLEKQKPKPRPPQDESWPTPDMGLWL